MAHLVSFVSAQFLKHVIETLVVLYYDQILLYM